MMARSLFMLIISLFVTVFASPAVLTAADEVALTGLNPAGIVETVPLPEPEPVQELANITYTEAYAPVYVAPVVQNYTVTAYV